MTSLLQCTELEIYLSRFSRICTCVTIRRSVRWYVLVLTLDAYPGLREADEAWIKIDGVKKVDGDYPVANFAWVEFDPSVANVRGFEAKFTLPPGQYLIDAHINVLWLRTAIFGNFTNDKYATFHKCDPEGSMLALTIGLIAAFGLFVAQQTQETVSLRQINIATVETCVNVS